MLIRSLRQFVKQNKKMTNRQIQRRYKGPKGQIGDIKQALVSALVGEMTCLKSKDEIK